MSNNRAESDPPKLMFLVVEYDGIKAAIARSANYQVGTYVYNYGLRRWVVNVPLKETLASIKKMFPVLRNMQDGEMFLNAHLEEVDDMLRIAEDIWSDLLPRLLSVKVTVDHSNEPEKNRTQLESAQPKQQAEAGVTIHIQRRLGGNWNNPVVQIYTTRISLDCTITQLIEQVRKQENIPDLGCYARYNGVQVAQMHSRLADLGIPPNALVDITP